MADGTEPAAIEPAAAEPVATEVVQPVVDPAVAEPAATPEPAGETLLTGDETGAPEDYAEFTLPEGMDVDTTLLDKAKPVLKELGLSQEKAQSLVNLIAESRQAEAQALKDSLTRQAEEWRTAAKTDPEFGGDAFNANLAKAAKALDKFGSPELRKMLNDTGIGNHPELVKFAIRIGAAISEDDPGGLNNATSTPQDPASRWYPEQSTGAN